MMPLYALPAGAWTQLPRTPIEVCSPDADTVIFRRGDDMWDLSVCPVLLLVRKTARPNAVWPVSPEPTLPYRNTAAPTTAEVAAWLS
jgi:hypothetical protein